MSKGQFLKKDSIDNYINNPNFIFIQHKKNEKKNVSYEEFTNHYSNEVSQLHSILEYNNLDYFEMVDYSKWNGIL